MQATTSAVHPHAHEALDAERSGDGAGSSGQGSCSSDGDGSGNSADGRGGCAEDSSAEHDCGFCVEDEGKEEREEEEEKRRGQLGGFWVVRGRAGFFVKVTDVSSLLRR